MLNSSSNSFISSLLNAGNDAFSNLYEVVITPDASYKDFTKGSEFSLRCTGFTPPSIAGGEPYKVNYITSFVEWPSANVNVTRNFDLTFRVDQNYEVYLNLHKLMINNFNPDQEFVATNLDDLKKYSSTVKVNIITNGSSKAEDSNKQTLFEFKNCLLLGIKPVEFKQGDATPLTATASFIFGEFVDMQTNQ